MSDPSVVLPRDGSRPGTPWWIRGTRFSLVDAGQTYDEQAVLQLREALAVAVESWQPVTPVIAAANLTASAGPGCDAAAVDQWLGTVRAAMHEGSAAPAAPQPVLPRAAAPVAAQPAPTATAVAETTVREAVAAPAAPAAPAATGPNAAIAQRINDARFTPLRFRPGYLVTEVDDFLDELVAAVSAGESIAARVQDVTFGSSRMKECYETQDVDAFLAQLVQDYEGVAISPPGAS